MLAIKLFTINKNSTKQTATQTPVALLLILLASITGCGKMQLPQLQHLSPLPIEPPCRIAVLPLNNESDHEKMDYIVYKIFTAELIRTSGLEVIQEGNVKKLYRQLQIFPGHQPSFDQLKIIANRLDVQLLVTGSINNARENFSKRAPDPSLTFSLQLIDAHSGRTIWNTYHNRNGQHYQRIMHFGTIASLSGLAHKMSQEIMDLWIREGLESGLQKCIE